MVEDRSIQEVAGRTSFAWAARFLENRRQKPIRDSAADYTQPPGIRMADAAYFTREMLNFRHCAAMRIDAFARTIS
jgi:hypothetical protein